MGDLRRITERYRLDKLETSSEGGSVFRGVDLESGETVAVELIDRVGGGSEEPRERFLETARALQALAHPGLPRVLDFGFTSAGSAFLVTEYLHGTPFQDFAGGPPGRVLSLLTLLVDGLEAMAEQGIVHGDLRAENLLVTPGDEGEQVKILGLGSAAPGPWDLHGFGLLACRMLRAPIEPEVGIPLEVAVELEDIEALRALLEAALERDPANRYRTWTHVRNALRQALFGAGGRRVGMRSETIVHPPDGLAEETGTQPDVEIPELWEVKTQVFLPPELEGLDDPEEEIPEEDMTPTVVIPPPEPVTVEPVRMAAASSRKRLPLVLGVSVAVLMTAAVALPLLLRNRPEPAPAPRPVPPPPVQASLARTVPAPPVPTPPIPEETAPEITAAIAPEELAGRLSRALEKGDLRALGSSVAALSEAGGDLPSEVRKSLARARRVLDLDARLSRARKSGSSLEVIRQATALLQEAPRVSRAAEQRERAAAAIEREADAEIEGSRFDAALDRLEGLRQAWPERSGLPERLDRLAAERKADQDLESLLAAAGRDEKAGKPLDGLQRLAGARPGPRWADRFQEIRHRLEAQAAELDRKSPELALRGSEPAYEKGKAGVVPLRITDDAGVKTVEGWARAEGGAWAKVAVRHLSGSDYALEVPPDVHQNRNVEYYAVATDASGHTGQLGTADSPRRMKRKNWIEKLLGGREKGP